MLFAMPAARPSLLALPLPTGWDAIQYYKRADLHLTLHSVAPISAKQL